MIPSVNDLLEQPLQNETSENEIMHDQVGQREFENSDEDEKKCKKTTLITAQRGTYLDLPVKEIGERDKVSKAILKTKQSL